LLTFIGIAVGEVRSRAEEHTFKSNWVPELPNVALGGTGSRNIVRVGAVRAAISTVVSNEIGIGALGT